MNFLENYNALLSLKRQKFDEKERNPSLNFNMTENKKTATDCPNIKKRFEIRGLKKLIKLCKAKINVSGACQQLFSPN